MIKQATRTLILALAIAVAFEVVYHQLAPNSPVPPGIHVLAGLLGVIAAAAIQALWARLRRPRGPA